MLLRILYVNMDVPFSGDAIYTCKSTVTVEKGRSRGAVEYDLYENTIW